MTFLLIDNATFAKLLIENGASIDLTEERGNSSLNIAVYWGKEAEWLKFYANN